MKNIALLISICFVLNVNLCSQDLGDSLTTRLLKFYQENEFVGFAVGVVNEDRLVYSRGFGFSDKKTAKPYSINTVQPIASISKTLIGVSLMKAQEMGLLNLDDDINKYLPFKIVNPYYPTETITIRQLANHTSTLKEPKYLQSYIFEEELPPLHKGLVDKKLRRTAKADVKERNLKATEESNRISIVAFIKERFHPSGRFYKKNNFVKSKPGAEYYYSNEGAALAAYIIESASGKSFVKFTTEYILDPLEMENSSWDHNSLHQIDSRDRSKLYYFGQEIPRFENITYPDGEFVTSVSDFSKYLMAMISGYNGESNILTADSCQKMMTKTNELDEEAILWEVDTKYDGYVGYSGADMGILTLSHFFKKERMGVVVFTNTSHLKNIDQRVIDLFFILKNFCEDSKRKQ